METTARSLFGIDFSLKGSENMQRYTVTFALKEEFWPDDPESATIIQMDVMIFASSNEDAMNRAKSKTHGSEQYHLTNVKPAEAGTLP